MFVNPHALSVLLFGILLFHLDAKIKFDRQQRIRRAMPFPGTAYAAGATAAKRITERAAARL